MQAIELESDISTMVSSLTGPKRAHDLVALSEMKEDFQKFLDNKVSSCNSNFTVSYTIELSNIRYYSVYTAVCIVKAVKFCRLASKDST